MEKRGMLLLGDPMRPNSRFSQMQTDTKALAFHEGECFLSQAQTALYRLRREYGWVCVAAGGSAVWIALALAEQLMVDRLALWMEAETVKPPRSLQRLQLYARRNLSLLASEILLVEPSQRDVRMFSRCTGRGCELRCMAAAEISAAALMQPWREDLFSARH